MGKLRGGGNERQKPRLGKYDDPWSWRILQPAFHDWGLYQEDSAAVVAGGVGGPSPDQIPTGSLHPDVEPPPHWAVAGGVQLVTNFGWVMAILLVVFTVNSFVILPLLSARHSCATCPQREDCPWMMRCKPST